MTDSMSPSAIQQTAPPSEQDLYLARALSRISALQGHAIPLYRFSMLSSTLDGQSFSGMSRAQKIPEMWLALFPSGRAQHVTMKNCEPADFPALWVSSGGEDVAILMGRLSDGSVRAQGVDGVVQDLSEQKVSSGQVWLIKPEEVSRNQESNTPKTAGDWFVYVVSRYRNLFFEAGLATLIVSAIGLFAALYSMQVYDRVIPSRGYSTLLVLTVGVVVAILMEFTLKVVRASMVDKACKAIDQELSAVFFGKALSIRLDERPRTVGTFASQIRHFESVRNFLTSSSLFILADTPFALLFIGVIAIIAGPVALVPLVVLVLSLVAGLMFIGPIGKLTASNMEESNRKNGVLIEAIDGIESIKATAAEWKLLDKWRRLTALISGSELRLRWLQTLSSNLTQLLQQVSYVGLVAVGAYAVSAGNLTMGGLIACSIISGRALAPIAQIPSMISQWKHAQIALKSLDAIMAMPSDRESDARLVIPERCAGEIRVEKLSFAYKTQRAAITVPSLSFSPGDRVAILGAIGSGKSTLIKLLSGLYRPSSGQLYLDGVDFTQIATEYVREHVGYLPQDVRLFQGTLRENLTLGLPTPPDSLILQAAAWTGLDSVIRQHPKGLELEISEGGRGLSGGQRQLVGLTRMLLAQPRIMLLDEPTASMDGQTETRVIRHLFQEVAADSVLVVVTHKTALLPLVNRIIVVDNGQILLDGPRDQVLARLREASTAAQNNSAAGSQAIQEVKA